MFSVQRFGGLFRLRDFRTRRFSGALTSDIVQEPGKVLRATFRLGRRTVWEYLFGANSDLVVDDFPDIDWQTSDHRDSLKQLAAYVIGEARKAESWYYKRKNQKRLWGILFRAGAIVLAALAAIYPVLALLFSSMLQGFGLRLEPAWASVLVAAAGLLILLDRFGGFTSGWIRYIHTAQRIGQQLRGFRFAWELERLKWGAKPTPLQLNAAVQMCSEFAVAVAQIVEDETKVWAQEFESVLQEIQASVPKSAATPETASLNLTVSNGDDSEGGWTLSVNDGATTDYHGKTASIQELLPGTHKVRVVGTFAGKTAAAETTVRLEPDKVHDCTLVLVASK